MTFWELCIYRIIDRLRRPDPPEYTWWFAWYPVHLYPKGWAWMRWVLRVKIPFRVYRRGWFWQYSIPSKNVRIPWS